MHIGQVHGYRTYDHYSVSYSKTTAKKSSNTVEKTIEFLSVSEFHCDP